MGRLTSVERQVAGEGPVQDLYCIARFEPWGQSHEAVALPLPDRRDHAVGDLRRRHAVHHQANNAGTPSRLMPLELDGDEQVAGEQPLNAPALLADLGAIHFEPALFEQQPCKAMTVRLQLRASPETHDGRS